MSLRAAKKPIQIPNNVKVAINLGVITISGPGTGGQNAQLDYAVHPNLKIDIDEVAKIINIQTSGSTVSTALIGTTYARIRNMFVGVTAGYEKKLVLVGVGYKAQLKGKDLNLVLGFSHPVEFITPDGITIEVPTQTEIIIRGIDKQKVGQVAAKIRAYRSPEPYKGKGVKYSDEIIIIKETKKK